MTNQPMQLVKNVQPYIQSSYNVAIIGEAPGEYEEATGQPFQGPSGNLLNLILSKSGTTRHHCYIGNVCQTRPPNNDLEKFKWEGKEIQEGLEQLRADMQKLKPNIVFLLGNTPLRAATGKKGSIKEWRGTIFKCDNVGSPFFGCKCIATYHPAYILRDAGQFPVLLFDFKKGMEERFTSELTFTRRNIRIAGSFEEAIQTLQSLREIGQTTPLAFDIEGGIDSISCFSFADKPGHALVIPIYTANGSHCWTEIEEARIWEATRRILGDVQITKVMQNALYDTFVLAYSYGILCRNVDDTMLSHWELYSELDKGLGFQASIYTKEPFYKFERKSDDWRTFLNYNGKDSCITYECWNKQQPSLSGDARKHYEFNKAMLRPLLYMQMRGIKLDTTKKVARILTLGAEMEKEQVLLNNLTSREVNINSPKQVKELLYNELKLPIKTKRGEESPTTNYEALLKLAKETAHPVVFQLIKLRALSKRISILESLKTDKDGRVRCSYNVVGTETGRLSCHSSVTGSGTNLQTIPEPDRDLFIADEGCWMFQCDLSGADGWTVAAHCKNLGDSTMLDDYLYGIKPAKVLALLIKGFQIPSSREELKALCDKEVKKEDWEYFCSKCIQHGSNYGMGKVTLATTIFIQSEGKVNVSAAKAEQYQQLYFRRYWGVPAWHKFTEEWVKKHGSITSASGHTRQLFGRRSDHSTIKQALADEPQQNTTYVTNKALLNLWENTNNQRQGKFLVEPLHQVHDALLGQFPQNQTQVAKDLIPRFFEVSLKIAGVSIYIPFEGKFGKSWGELKEGMI